MNLNNNYPKDEICLYIASIYFSNASRLSNARISNR